jgi:hypothetical protein
MLWDNIMSSWTHPLDLASGSSARLVLATALLAVLWSAIAWALTA